MTTLINSIYRIEKANGLDINKEDIETILNGTGTKADGTIYDIIETLRDYCEPTRTVKTLISTLYGIA